MGVLAAPLLLGLGCPQPAMDDSRPCDIEGIFEGDVILSDDLYLDRYGRTVGVVGDGRLSSCRYIHGEIVLGRHPSSLADFTRLRQVDGIRVMDGALPRVKDPLATSPLASCGLLQGFPSLENIIGSIHLPPGDEERPCVVYEGLSRLRYVGGDIRCGQTASFADTLEEVAGTLECRWNLPALRSAGHLRLTGEAGSMPKLEHVGVLQLEDATVSQLTLPALTSVGPFRGVTGLRVIGNLALWRVSAPRLQSIAGPLIVVGNGRAVHDGTSVGVGLREAFADVEVIGAAVVCGNGAMGTDPCALGPCPDAEMDDRACCDISSVDCEALAE